MEHFLHIRPPTGDAPNFRVCQKKKYGDINALSKWQTRYDHFDSSNIALQSYYSTSRHVVAGVVLFMRNASFGAAQIKTAIQPATHGHFAALRLVDEIVGAFQIAQCGGKHRSRGSGPNIFKIES